MLPPNFQLMLHSKLALGVVGSMSVVIVIVFLCYLWRCCSRSGYQEITEADETHFQARAAHASSLYGRRQPRSSRIAGVHASKATGSLRLQGIGNMHHHPDHGPGDRDWTPSLLPYAPLEVVVARDARTKGHRRSRIKAQPGTAMDEKKLPPVKLSGTAAEAKTAWLPDELALYCEVCVIQFTDGILGSVRRHHCRRCGLVFCEGCTAKKERLPLHGFPRKQVRVCSRCWPLARRDIELMEKHLPLLIHGGTFTAMGGLFSSAKQLWVCLSADFQWLQWCHAELRLRAHPGQFRKLHLSNITNILDKSNGTSHDHGDSHGRHGDPASRTGRFSISARGKGVVLDIYASTATMKQSWFHALREATALRPALSNAAAQASEEVRRRESNPEQTLAEQRWLGERAAVQRNKQQETEDRVERTRQMRAKYQRQQR